MPPVFDWARLDVGILRHPKVIGLASDALRLFYLEAILHAVEQGTDGGVTASWVTGVARRPIEWANELADAKLLDRIEGGYRIHNFERYQPPASYADDLSDKRRMAALQRWHPGVSATDMHLHMQNGCKCNAKPMHVDVNVNVNGNTNPTPQSASQPGPRSVPGAADIIAAFNAIFQTKFSAPTWQEKIARCVKAHPEMTLANHRELIEYEHAHPWWTRSPSPAVIYGTPRQFETCVNRGGAVAPNGKGQRAARLAEQLEAWADRKDEEET